MLAGKMKLNHFLLIAAAVAGAVITGAYFTCRGGDDHDNREHTAEAPPAPVPDNVPTAPSAPAPTPTPVDTPTTPEPVLASPEPVAAPPADDGLREVDRELLKWAGKDLGSKKIKDARKGRAWKINLYQDAGKSSVNRAKVDLDRDDKWDEKWTFDGTNIARKVAPNDDEDYADAYDWDGKRWVKR